MKKPLWIPDEARKEKANMTAFMRFINDKFGTSFKDYFELYRWSVQDIPSLWAAVWEFVGVKASQPYEVVVDDPKKFPGAKWFVGARANFAENLLRKRSDEVAFVFRNELGVKRTMSYREVYDFTRRLALALKRVGVKRGDRVGAYMPNIIETPLAMLATTALGAAWSSCGTELGVQAVIDRLGQIEPKVLFVVDGYPYKGKLYDVRDNVEEVIANIPSLEKVVVVPYVFERPEKPRSEKAVYLSEFIDGVEGGLSFEQIGFDEPVYIMFSSGTTGKPKCMVQGLGVLVNHLKELIIHADLKEEDVITYMTAPSWMMWNWLMSSLAVGCRIVLFDGNPAHPDLSTMWKLIEEERITVFGTSATYIYILKGEDFRPKGRFDLSSLKEILQTGSPLSADGFQYVYEAIKDDVHFNSISGGTDINGCFAIGSPVLPVYAGELQSPGLGMKIKAYDEKGQEIYDQQGELVCEAPCPSMPLYFWNDPDFSKYKEAYFSVYPGVWRHGDYVEFHSDTGGITFYGRSDATLKPSGVRIGTAEIYNIVEKIEGIVDSLAVGQNWEGDQRIILFVKLKEGVELTEELIARIKRELRDKASPRHVPALVIQAPDIPYTFNMKKVETAVSNIINGRPVTNRDAIVNPECLAFYEEVARKLREV